MSDPKKALLLALGLLAAPVAAQAQDSFGGVFDMGALTNTLALDHLTQSERARAERPKAGGAPAASLTEALALQAIGRAVPAATPIESARYTPSSAVREKLAGIMADAQARADADAVEEMRELVLSGRAVEEYRRIAPSVGLKTDDAVDALAFYLLAQWGVANDYRAAVTPAQVSGVRRQAAAAYAAVADRLDSDALRQEFGEMLIVQGVVMAGVHEAAARNGDEAALQRYADLARRGGHALFNTDPTQIALTDQGFRRK